jgi:hypothetical protein
LMSCKGTPLWLYDGAGVWGNVSGMLPLVPFINDVSSMDEND